MKGEYRLRGDQANGEVQVLTMIAAGVDRAPPVSSFLPPGRWLPAVSSAGLPLSPLASLSWLAASIALACSARAAVKFPPPGVPGRMNNHNQYSEETTHSCSCIASAVKLPRYIRS